ncbi:hypothetical protein JW948_08625 [bacterium]|nr:hypothetical protein [bacterium]
MKTFGRIIFILFLLILACTRSHRTTSDPVYKKVTDATADLLILQGSCDPSSPAYQDSALSILEIHHLTKEEYISVYNEINIEPERWEAFLQQVIDQIELKEPARVEQISDRKNPLILERAVE